MTPFILDETLAKDTVFIRDLSLSRLLLMNDRRYPWLILVPRRMGLVELGDLTESELTQLMQQIVSLQRRLTTGFNCHKVNIGAIGNRVRMLHIHIVGRQVGDPAWPAPVWGHSPAEPYLGDSAQMVIDKLGLVE
ncbi:MAG: HIT family protein [Candidatus Pacebacteria bacterium]|nr:HIT family protein [Candidatus Paceibacterota bacterium]